ncbi:hypothetical protein FSOLCH5_015394 [Fusarium solani]
MPGDDSSTDRDDPSSLYPAGIGGAPLAGLGGSTFSGRASAGRDALQGNVQKVNVAHIDSIHFYNGTNQSQSPAPKKEEQFKQPKDGKSNRNSKGPPAGDSAAAMAPKYLYRVTEIDINESQEAISDALRGFDPEKGANKQFRIPRGLDTQLTTSER